MVSRVSHLFHISSPLLHFVTVLTFRLHPFQLMSYILGTEAERNVVGMLEMLPSISTFTFCKSDDISLKPASLSLLE